MVDSELGEVCGGGGVEEALDVVDESGAAEGAGGGTKRVTLALVRTWKGLENKESVIVSTSDSSASCGYTFEPNTSYLVYASGSETALEVSGCSRTRAMTDASEDLAILGAGITPVEVNPAPAPETKPPAPKTGGCGSVKGAAQASASLMLLPVTGLALRARRRRQRG